MSTRRNVYDRTAFVDAAFLALLEGWTAPAPAHRPPLDEPLGQSGPITGRELLELFESQVLSRHIDLMARVLRARDQAFYTIGSSGHEGNAVLGRLTRATDPAFLHYRS